MKNIMRIIGILAFTSLGLYILGSFVGTEPDEPITEESDTEIRTPVENTSVDADVKETYSTEYTKYQQIKEEYELFGKWEIKTIINFVYPYEIYEKDGEYIGVYANEEYSYKVDRLEKRNNNYYVIGNDYGEYFNIDVRGDMSMYDEDGRVDIDFGYEIRKLQ